MSGNIRGFGYLESLPPVTFRRLYQQPATALAIFRRMLPNLAKTIVTTLLYNETPVALGDLEALVRPESYREREDAFSKLRRLHIITENNLDVSLDPVFKKNFRGDHHSFGVPCNTEDKKKITVQFLDNYATRQFEAILHYMVGTHNEVKPSEGVITLLTKGGLMERYGAGSQATITKNGFSFLLQDGNPQVWALLIQYLEMAEELGMEQTDVLHFLLMLGSLELGQAYSVNTLTETQKLMLADLRDYGIVYQRKSSSDRFYPTRLATTLTSESGGLRSASASMSSAMVKDAEEGKGFIILETNYRVYAYTNSPLQIAVLNLFVKLSTRYPNLVSGRISRRSIQEAIKMGITADQVIDYLSSHAHPQMRKSLVTLPPTVVDQIRLWQIEGERMKTTTGFLFKDFHSTQEFEEVAKYAEELGVLKWKKSARRCMFVTRHEQIADWLKRRASAQQQQPKKAAA
ncbi:transcription factor Tfb2-domain-containing protein [Tuber borchii]|uniref:RNA polymerase II transcription factor B subunit 2 n=1 Tax=Tuber borchii TaxID=42251 RepID=A0A2T7A3D4_TUBBO|nr:transcription factor Tfb2-domain-containing protein [Tuber borchii]